MEEHIRFPPVEVTEVVSIRLREILCVFVGEVRAIEIEIETEAILDGLFPRLLTGLAGR